MPVFSMQIFKGAFGKVWSNRYHINGADLSDARDVIPIAVQYEQTLYPEYIDFTRVLLSTITENDRVFLVEVQNTPGARSTSTDRMPFFNTLRLDFTVGGLGDSARKYHRCLVEADSVGGNIADPLVAIAQAETDDFITQMAAAGYPICKVDGSLLSLVSVFAEVQERQLRRRNKPKVVPI